MAGTRPILRARACLPLAALLGAAAIAGCGSSGSKTVTKLVPTPGVRARAKHALSSTMIARGPRDLEANLAALVAKGQPQLTHFNASCPPEPTPPRYPVLCKMTAIDTSKLGKKGGLPDGEHRPVTGTVTVAGVYPRTRTYVYTLNYAPVNPPQRRR